MLHPAVVTVLLVVLTASPLAAQVEVARAIDLLQAFEARYEAYRWKFKVRKLDVPEKANLSEVTASEASSWESQGEYSGSGEVVYDLTGGRFHVLSESVRPWEGGAAPFVASRQGWSYDGTVHRQWKKEQHGTEIPESVPEFSSTLSPLIGTVSAIPEDETGLAIALHGAGIQSLPPFVDLMEKGPTVRRLSDILKTIADEGVALTVEETADGEWVVEIPYREVMDAVVIVHLDPGRGGVVTEILWRINGADGPFMRTVYNLVEIADSVWLPDQITSLRILDNIAYQTTLSDVEVNPALSNDDFVLQMPKGAVVDDFLEKQTYTVGGGASEDASTVRAFLERYELASLPEPVSLEREQSSTSNVRGWLISLNILFVCSAVIGVVLIRRRQSALSVFFAMAFLSCGEHNVVAEITFQKGSWVVSHSGSIGVPVNQCGFNVSIMALEMFGRTYDPAVVAKTLVPTAEGTLFSDILQLCEGTGLKIEVRSDVSIDEIDEGLPLGYLAIFPVSLPHGPNHYLACVRDSNEDCLVIDAPNEVTRLKEFDTRGLAEQYKHLLVAFVSLPPKTERKALGELVEFSTSRVHLGDIEINDAKRERTRKVDIALENPSNTAVFVGKVSRSCACTSTSWFGGVIAPGASCPVTLEIDTMSWGHGEISRSVTFVFGDGTTKNVEVVGVGVTSEDIQKLNVVPRDMFIEVDTTIGNGGQRIVRDAEISGNADTLKSLDLRSDAKWLSVEETGKSGQDIRIQIVVNLDDEMLDQIARAATPVRGSLAISVVEGESPVKLCISLTPKRFFKMDTRFLRFEGSMDAATVTITPSEGNVGDLLVSELRSEPEGLEFANENRGDGSTHIVVKLPESTAAGYYRVRFLVSSPLKNGVLATGVGFRR